MFMKEVVEIPPYSFQNLVLNILKYINYWILATNGLPCMLIDINLTEKNK